jgi:anti-sigma regulatory factor (Ser/Thr protein kinase)
MQHQIETLDLVPDREAIKVALRWLEGIAHKQGWSAELAFALTLSLDEALSNVLMHAFVTDHAATLSEGRPCARSVGRISLSCSTTQNEVRIEVADNGIAYDPTSATLSQLPGSIESARIGGHGLRLMRFYLSQLSYTRTDTTNRLTLAVNLNEWQH